METPGNTNPNVLKGMLENYVEPSGTVEITENGTVDVSEFASAEVNVSGGTIEGLDFFPLEITVAGETGVKYVKFYNVFAGMDKDHIAFYDVLTSRQIASNNYKLFYPYSSTDRRGFFEWSSYGNITFIVSNNTNTSIIQPDMSSFSGNNFFGVKPGTTTQESVGVTFNYK